MPRTKESIKKELDRLVSDNMDELAEEISDARKSKIQGLKEKEEQEARQEEETVRSIASSLNGSAEEERSRLWGILDTLPCYVTLLDVDHNIILANKAFREYFGSDQGLCYSVLREKDKACSPCPPFDSFEANSSCVMEWITPDSKHAFRTYCYPFNDVSGKKLLLKAGFSVTASIKMRQALSLSESSYRVITDNLSIGVAVLGLDLKVIVGNVRLNQWFSRNRLKGMRLCDLLHCNGSYPFPVLGAPFCPDCPFGEALKDKNAHEKEFRLFDEGREKILRLVACPVAPEKKKVKALVLMLEDITKRIYLNRQLQRARNIEAAGTLAGGIAHEINQPLSALSLYASGLQILLEKSEQVDQKTVSERLDLILKESERIRSIIANMRALVMRGSNTEFKGVDLYDCLVAAVETTHEQLGNRGIRVEYDIPDDLPQVQSHSVQLEQAVVNLISNAVHAIDAIYAENTAEVEAGGKSRKLQKLIRFTARISPAGDKVLLAVEDSGTGLLKEQERVFDPFFSTKGNNGMGLGLSIVNGLVNGWGGELSVKPRGGELGGAIFYIAFKILSTSDEETDLE